MAKYDQLPGLLAAADIFILPSLQEGLPLSLLEAMACGLPVIATDVGGIGKVIENGASGMLVPPADPGGIRDALQALIVNAELRDALGRAARQRALDYSWSNVWKRYADLLAGSPSDLS